MLPEHVLSVSVTASGKDAELSLSKALTKLKIKDRSLGIRMDSETGQMSILGVGTHHLQEIQERLKGEFGLVPAYGPYRVVYRETISRKVREEATFIRQSGGRRQYANCVLELTPLKDDDGFEFENKAKGIPLDFVAGVERGVREALETGGPHGEYPLVALKATLVSAKFVEDESSEMTFKIAGAMALRSGCRKAFPVILEPIMKFEAAFPKKIAEDSIVDLIGRRAKILDVVSGPMHMIRCLVPLSEMFGFKKRMPSGMISYKMELSRFEEISVEKWKASNDPHSPDEPPTASAGRPVKPIKPKPGIPGGKGKDFPPEADA